jgi:hypothetical protein
MTKSTKIILWTVAGIATLGIGAGIALWYYGKKHPKEADAVPAEKDASGEPSLDATPVKKVTFSTDIPQGSDDIKAFQTWVNNYKKPNPLLKVDGIWGAKSQAQWDLYSKDYAKRNRTVAGGGSGIAANTPLYVKGDIANVYSYPMAGTKYLLGSAKRSAKMFARFDSDSSVAGWIKVKALYNELSGAKPVVQIVYVQLKDVTTVAP